MERVFLVRSGDRTGLPVTIIRFLPAAPSSPHLSQELLPEAVAGAARMHSSDRRPPLLPAEESPVCPRAEDSAQLKPVRT